MIFTCQTSAKCRYSISLLVVAETCGSKESLAKHLDGRNKSTSEDRDARVMRAYHNTMPSTKIYAYSRPWRQGCGIHSVAFSRFFLVFFFCPTGVSPQSCWQKSLPLHLYINTMSLHEGNLFNHPDSLLGIEIIHQ